MTINAMRKDAGLTWAELAEKTGYSRRTLSDAQHKKHSKALYNAVKKVWSKGR